MTKHHKDGFCKKTFKEIVTQFQTEVEKGIQKDIDKMLEDLQLKSLMEQATTSCSENNW